MNSLNKLKEILLSEDNFISKVRFGGGFDNQLYEELYNALQEVSESYKMEMYIPKEMVSLVIDIVPSLINSSFFYKDQQLEQVNKAIDELSSILRHCFD